VVNIAIYEINTCTRKTLSCHLRDTDYDPLKIYGKVMKKLMLLFVIFSIHNIHICLIMRKSSAKYFYRLQSRLFEIRNIFVKLVK